MPRNYPRFLLSNVTESKSNGIFVVHLLEPKLLLRVIPQDRTFEIKVEEFICDHTAASLTTEGVLKDARNFVISKIAAGKLTI